MSDGDPYDADSDVDRFLNFPSPEDHPYGLSEPEGTVGGPFQYAPATEQAFPAAPQTLPAPATEIHGQPPPDFGVQLPATEIHGHPAPDFGVQLPATGIHGHPAPQKQNVAPEAPAIYGAEHYEAAPINNAEHYEASAINADDHHMAGMYVEPQYEEMAIDVQPTHMLAPEMQQGYGIPDPTLRQGDGVHGDHYQYHVPIMDAYHHVAPPPINGEHYQPLIMNAEHHQVPAMDIGQYEAMAVDVQQTAHMLPPETQQAYGLPDPTPMQGDGGVDAVHYEAPPINAQHYEAPAFNNDEHHQVQAMAMEDVVEPPTHAPAPEMQIPQAHGAFPDPTPMPQQGGGGGVDGASWLEGESMFPPPSPTMCRMLDELAAMLQATDGAEGNAGGGAKAAAPDDDDDDVGPADDEVTFKPIVPGRLDCARCRSVREVLALHGTLRGRRHEWVQNFIAKSVEKMKTKNAGLVQDTCGPSTSYGAAAGDNNISVPHPSAAVVDNNITAPQPSNHGHMELEVGMLNNLLSATAPIAHQAATPEAAQPAQAQGKTDAPNVSEAAIIPEAAQPAVTQAQGNTDAPSVAEAAIPEATPSEAAQPAVTQAQEKTDAPSVAEAAAAPEASPPEAAQPSENPDAPSVADEAQVPAAAHQPATDALDKFPPFNWEGFKPDHILESSQVPPYDPASGVDVLMYPSMQEHLRVEALKREEGKKLSKMTVQDTPDYLNINDDHLANAPNFASALFKLLCQKDPTYRMFKRRVSGLNRKIKKLEQSATKVGTGGLFKIKQKMETFKGEKQELYDVINRGMQELENGRRNDGAGPSNRPGPSNSAGPSNGAGPSSNVAGTSNNNACTSNVACTSNDGAGPSNVAGTSNEDAGPSNVAGTSNEDAGPSNVAGPSGTK
ncbi:hypothetical protein SETIT_3G078600v2 [Setaria italica]|uniref:Uncharacterized protein n=1 Tax=Setaria italica TaxID=4555 RepID=A0A368QCV4_SETIT|nr:hypothetical protein SETIT_3G078600v2 [Setaria italica]